MQLSSAFASLPAIPAIRAASHIDPLRRVLFVEAEPQLGHLVKTALSLDANIQITCASGGDPLAAIEKDEPDLLLLDLGTHVDRAVALLRELRASPSHMQLPVVLLHEHPLPVGGAIALDYAIGSIPKPLDVAHLPRQLREFWERRPI